jgi:hypothetical protein
MSYGTRTSLLRTRYHNGQSSFSFIDVLHSREMERLNLFGWRGLEIESNCARFAEFKGGRRHYAFLFQVGGESSLAAARGGVQRRGTSGVELRADGVADALLDEAKQFGFDVVAGELERELLGALTVTRLREDLVESMPDRLRGRLVGAQVDPCA